MADKEKLLECLEIAKRHGNKTMTENILRTLQYMEKKKKLNTESINNE